MTLNPVINAFVHNFSDCIDEKFTYVNKMLYQGGVLIGANNKDVMLLSKNINSDLLFDIALAAGKLRIDVKRVDLTSYTNSTAIEKSLSSDKQLFIEASRMYGFEYTQEELELDQKLKDFKKRVSSFFEAKREEQAAARAKLEHANKSLVEKKIYEDWDAGVGICTDPRVKGAGDSTIRLRLKKGATGIEYVESSQGQKTRATLAKRAWEYACKHWYEGKKLSYNGKSTYNLGRNWNSRSATVFADTLAVGCQKIAKAECERFADLHGWSRTST